MKPWERLDRITTPDGSWLELRRHDGEYTIAADGYDLMVSRVHKSEDELVRLACPEPLGAGGRILVGGLGMGYTLRAALDRVPADGQVVVAELLPQVVAWNHEYMGSLAGYPLRDPRVEVYQGDVGRLIRGSSPASFDVIVLDVDNGPDSFSQEGNASLYTATGIAAIKVALRPGGVLGVWAVGPSPAFERRLRAAGFEPSTHHIRAHGTRATVFIGWLPVPRP